MAWRSSGTNNDEMVNNLKRFGVIHSTAVEDGFRRVDRRFFVPPSHVAMAHSDQPLRHGAIHVSAPHIYGTIMEALELTPNTSFSFLNAGSGTGYLSSMVAVILGPTSLSVNIDCHADAIAHSKQAVDEWKASMPNPKDLPDMQFLHGNVLNMDVSQGECLRGFDRIYVGAALEKSNLAPLASLLKVGGILVGPVDDELVKVVRVGKGLGGLSQTRTRIPRSFRGQPPPLSDEFYQQILSGVRFTPLVKYPAIPVVIPSKVWSPAVHYHYPDSFRRASNALVVCSRAPIMQPPPEKVQERVNVAPMLPQSLWSEILSYTHRDWFEQARSDEDFLRQRLREEQETAREAQEGRLDAESRLHLAERERDVYRLLALRWQSRLRTVMNERGDQDVDDEAFVGSEDVAHVAAAVFADEPISIGLGGLSVLIRRFQAQYSDSDNEAEEESDHQGRMEDDSESEDDSAAMEDESEVTGPSESMAESPPTSQSLTVRTQPRTVSISSEDI